MAAEKIFTYPTGFPVDFRLNRRFPKMQTTEDSLVRLESQHAEILNRIDELDRQIAQVLEEWSKPSVPESDIEKNTNIDNRF